MTRAKILKTKVISRSKDDGSILKWVLARIIHRARGASLWVYHHSTFEPSLFLQRAVAEMPIRNESQGRTEGQLVCMPAKTKKSGQRAKGERKVKKEARPQTN